ncbi:MAG: hypothetical protein GVY10_08755 [Verrucomicrobia bacterium]|nr:hypothetical protein [Verrucomicrobiota bacterium]
MQKSASVEYLYGLNPAFECLRAGRRRLQAAFINERAGNSGRFGSLLQLITKAGLEPEPVDKGRLQQLCGSREHQNVVLKAARYPYVPLRDCLSAKRLLLLDNVEDPHNVGAILRSAEVLGFHHVLLPTRGVPEVYPSVAKVSAGATEFLRIARESSAISYVRKAAEAGYTIAALDAAGKTPLGEFHPADNLLLVIGGEDKGVRRFILNEAHTILSIPQQGRVNSLNASVAAALAMHALR